MRRKGLVITSRAVYRPLRRCHYSTAETRAQLDQLDKDLRTQEPQYWRDLNHQRRLFDEIGRQLGIKELNDWYWVPKKEVISRGGWKFFDSDEGGADGLRMYKSLEDALKAIYPEHSWQSTRFIEQQNRMGRGFWREKKNLLKALTLAEIELNIKQPEDWYSVTLADLREVSAFPRLSKVQLADLLNEKYPGLQWERMFTQKGKYKQQHALETVITLLFPDNKKITNARKEAGIVNPKTGEFLEVDVYLPEMQLAFEYQEKHHYIPTTYNPLEAIQNRDRVKRQIAKEKGITLIIVPCWWDGTLDSIIATIQKERKDLFSHIPFEESKVISEEVPSRYFEKQTPIIEDIGEAPLASFFTLSSVDPTNWWMFEKYDGVRAFWNPLKKAFYSRQGNKFNTIAQEVIDSMPTDTFLDGELWFGPESFQEAMKIAGRAEATKIDWTKFKYMVFDVPNHKGTYAERYALLEEMFGAEKEGTCKYIALAVKEKCRDTAHMESFFQDIIDKGGEGIILRDPFAPFQAGRATGYLKHKKFRDSEARVVKKIGMFQWECELPNMVRFVAVPATTKFAQKWDPKEGDIVTFKHHGFLGASGKPKMPTLHRIRTDLSWDDVIRHWKDQKTSSILPTPARALPSRIIANKKFEKKPKHYWSDINRQRAFLDELKVEFNISKPSDWQRVSRTDIENKGGRRLIKKYASVDALLKAVYGDASGKRLKKQEYWKDIQNVRNYFNEFAQRKGFDPTDPSGWYSNLKSLNKEKGTATLRAVYGGWRNALRLAYPDIAFYRWPFFHTQTRQQLPQQEQQRVL